jgi:antibiotic biosynthesis monooxygenase (ABM) superfamily enzyme
MSEPVQPVPVWKRGLAVTLDLFTAFFFFGWLIGHFSGGTTEHGFYLTGGPAVLLFAVIVGYFYIGRRHAGGTLWDRILGIGRPQPTS